MELGWSLDGASMSMEQQPKKIMKKKYEKKL